MSTVAEALPEMARAAGAMKCEDGAACRHHWVIESPNGSISRGVCKHCGEEKSFNNSADRYLIRKTGRAS